MECKGCKVGIGYCYHRPCWGTPEEFDKILDAGYASKVQLEFWHQASLGIDNILILAPAVHLEVGAGDFDIFNILFGDDNKTPRSEREYQSEHNGGKVANMDPLGKCAMLTEDNLCELHSKGLKPVEGRDSCCKVDPDRDSHKGIALLWDTDYGKSVVEKWKQLVKFNN